MTPRQEQRALTERLEKAEADLKLVREVIEKQRLENELLKSAVKASHNMLNLRMQHPFGTKEHAPESAWSKLEIAQRKALRELGMM